MKWSKIQFSLKGVKETKKGEWAVRFFFGGIVSAFAGFVGQKWGAVVGGLFLGFPSILPATVTLVKRHRGRGEAGEDARGAAIGSLGLITFAWVVFATAESWGALLSLSVATLVWLTVNCLAWWLFS